MLWYWHLILMLGASLLLDFSTGYHFSTLAVHIAVQYTVQSTSPTSRLLSTLCRQIFTRPTGFLCFRVRP